MAVLYNLARLGISIDEQTKQRLKREEKLLNQADPDQQVHQPLPVVVKNYGVRRGRLLVPRILVEADAVIRRDLSAEGLFRVSGSATKLKELLGAINYGETVDGSTQDWTGLVKTFLRELPEPLLTVRLYSAFVQAAQLNNLRNRIRALKLLCLDLPTAHLHVLIHLLSILASVVAYPNNRMTAQTLASIIAPNILRPVNKHDLGKLNQAAVTEQGKKELVDHAACCRAVTLLILHHAEIGLVPIDVDNMAQQFAEGEAKKLYQHLLMSPCEAWLPRERAPSGVLRSASARASSKSVQKEQNRSSAPIISFGERNGSDDENFGFS